MWTGGKVLYQIKTGKALGTYAIMMEMTQVVGNTGIQWLRHLCNDVIKEEFQMTGNRA